MTISVSSNGDGTMTVTCGTESIQIGSSSSVGTLKPKNSSGDTPILWPNGGTTATFIAKKGGPIIVVQVPAGADLARAIKEHFESQPDRPWPTIFKVQLQDSEPLSVEDIKRAIAEVGMQHMIGIQIQQLGSSDG